MAAKWREFSSAQIYQFYVESATQKEFFMKMGYKESKDYSSTMKEFKKVYPDIVFGHSKYRLGQRIGNIKLIEECGREVGSQLFGNVNVTAEKFLLRPLNTLRLCALIVVE